MGILIVSRPSERKKGAMVDWCVGECEYCGKHVERRACQVKSNLFCSAECGNLYRRKEKFSLCECCGERFRVKNITQSAGRFCSKECMLKMKVYADCKNCGKRFYAKHAKNNPSKYCCFSCYNEARKCETSGRVGMYLWKKAVYKKYDYTCQNCGSKNNPCAHHIYSYKHYEDLRTEESNGIVYCESCHRLIHKIYGYNSKNKMKF